MSLLRRNLIAALVLASTQTVMAQGLPQDPPRSSPPAATSPGCAEVEVRNVRPQQGMLMVAAYSSAADFGKKPSAALRLKAADAVMRFQLCGVEGPTVALTLFQDLDSDGQMGRNPVGMPTEPWGSSGTPGPFGPTWETTQVPLDSKLIVILMSS